MALWGQEQASAECQIGDWLLAIGYWGEDARVTTADGSKLPLLPSGPGGVHKSAFHGPWRGEEKRKVP